MQDYEIEELWLYPIKSLPGISVKTASVKERGLAFDRRFMLVDDEGVFISLRGMPELYDFEVAMEGSIILLNHPNGSIQIDANLSGSEQRPIQLWDDRIQAYQLGDVYDEWFSDILGQSCSLVGFGKESTRPIQTPWNSGEEQVSFADGFPYLIISRKSLKDIEQRTGMEMDLRRFRPNIVVDGTDAYDEFHWGKMVIGEVILQGLKPCKRCVVTTYDPDTKDRSKEPLASLAGLHMKGAAVFGQNAKMLKPGRIAVGDKVIIADKKPPSF